MPEPLLWPLGLGLLGAVFGSFIATIAVRWPQERSAARGRSACDACGKGLRAHELVPLVSYILQRGRCRGCAASIRPSHFWIEVLGLAIGLAAGLAAPGPVGAAGAVFGWLLLSLAALDLAAFWLPNRLTGALALAGMAASAAGWSVPPVDALIGGLAGFGALWCVAAAYRALRGREGLGGGDPKLFGAIGLWLGWRALPGVLLAASLIGIAAVAVMKLAGREVRAHDRLPLGVMLALAAWGAWLVLAVGAG